MRKFSPDASITPIWVWRGKSKPPGPHFTASCFPSGE